MVTYTTSHLIIDCNNLLIMTQWAIVNEPNNYYGCIGWQFPSSISVLYLYVVWLIKCCMNFIIHVLYIHPCCTHTNLLTKVACFTLKNRPGLSLSLLMMCCNVSHFQMKHIITRRNTPYLEACHCVTLCPINVENMPSK